MKKHIRIFASMLAVCVLTLSLSACTLTETEESADQPDVFAEVYNDGITAVETRRLIRLPGSSSETEYCFLEVRLTNSGTEPVYYSSLLCLKASSGDTVLPTNNAVAANNAAAAAIADYTTLDGEISPGESAEGFVFFEAPAGLTEFDISLATDFGAGEWISFSCAAQ